MSWFSDNYEKATLGGAAILAVALVVVGFKNKSDLTATFMLAPASPNKETDVVGLPPMLAAKTSMGVEHEVRQADVDGRKIDLFTGVPLFSKRDDKENPVDLLKSDPVHAGISNTLWMKYGLDPGFADSPDRDPDKDGFSNREEFTAETDPTSAEDYPEPVVKLKALDVDTTQVHIKPQDLGGGGKRSLFKLETKSQRRVNKMEPKPIGVGEVISFIKPLMQKRFKFAELDKRQNQNGMVDTIWVIEDLKPNKKGVKYRFDKRGDLDGHKGHTLGIMDSTAELSLEALGQNGKSFKVEENTRFSLPFNPGAPAKPYLLKSIDREKKQIEVEYTDKQGNMKIHLMQF